MFETIDANTGDREKPSAALKNRMLRIAAIVGGAVVIFGVLYVGLLMIE